MQRKLATPLALIFFILVVASVIVFPALAQQAPKITKEEVKAMLGNADVIIIDVRHGGDWNSSATKITGAVREDTDNINSWIGNYPKDKTLIFYCA